MIFMIFPLVFGMVLAAARPGRGYAAILYLTPTPDR